GSGVGTKVGNGAAENTTGTAGGVDGTQISDAKIDELGGGGALGEDKLAARDGGPISHGLLKNVLFGESDKIGIAAGGVGGVAKVVVDVDGGGGAAILIGPVDGGSVVGGDEVVGEGVARGDGNAQQRKCRRGDRHA